MNKKLLIGIFSVFLFVGTVSAEFNEPVEVNEFQLNNDEGLIVLDHSEDNLFNEISLILNGEEEVFFPVEAVDQTEQGIHYEIMYENYEPEGGESFQTDLGITDSNQYELETVEKTKGDEVLEFDIEKISEDEVEGTLVTKKDFDELQYFEARLNIDGEPFTVPLEASEYAEEYDSEYEDKSIVRYEISGLEDVEQGQEVEIDYLVAEDQIDRSVYGDLKTTNVEDTRYNVLEFETLKNPETSETDVTVVFEKDFEEEEVFEAEVLVNGEPQFVELQTFEVAEEYDNKEEYEDDFIVRYEMYGVEGGVGDEIQIDSVFGEDFSDGGEFQRGVIDGTSTFEDSRMEVLEMNPDDNTIVFNKDYDQKQAFEIQIESDGETYSRELQAFEVAEEYDSEYEDKSIVRYEIINLEEVVFGDFEVTSVTVEEEEERGLRGETEGELISIINEYSSSEDLSEIIRISNNIEVVDNRMNLEDGNDVGSVTVDTQSTQIELDVTIEDGSAITSDDLFEDGNLEEEMVLTESGTYLVESPRTTATIDMERNSDVSINSLSEAGEEQDIEIPTVVVGQNLEGDLTVEGETEQDYYYEDGEVTYIHATEYLAKVDGEDEEVLSQGEWIDIGTVEESSGEAGVVSDYSFTGQFDEVFYSTGDYVLVSTVVESTNTVDTESLDQDDLSLEDWQGWEHEEIDRESFEFRVIEPDEPQSPTESLGNFFNSIIDSVVDTLNSVFSSGELVLPSLDSPSEI